MTAAETGLGHWPEISGRIVAGAEGVRHELAVRVYFEDTDAGGIVYHASFIRFAERGRTDFLRLLGTDARRMIDGSESREPAVFVVRRMAIEYLKPARMDDLLIVETRVKEIAAASVTLLQTIRRDATRLFEAEVLVVLVAVSGKPLRLPERVRVAFEGQKR